MNRRQFTSLTLTGSLSLLAGMTVPVQPPPRAQQHRARVVLELFTSQGCSSCPAADALFERFTAMPDVLALTFPVDYWDYLGWKDTLAKSKFTQRQRHYGKSRGDGQIYTPQLVINGRTHTNGADFAAIEHHLAAQTAARQSALIPVDIVADKKKLAISASAQSGNEHERALITVWLATLKRRVEVPVQRGENAGKTLTYFNVVRELAAVGTWGAEALAIDLDRATIAQSGEDACAVILQRGQVGPIVGASLLHQL